MKISPLDRFFHYTELKSSFRTEVIAGLSTFAAMAYILCIQPALFSGQMTGTATGMPFGALVTTTCIASAIGSILMGVMANYPVGLAPGMGSNFFVLFSVMTACAVVTGGKMGDPVVWQTAMGVVLISGILFLLTSFTKLRKMMLNSLSPSLKFAIVTGIGLFIAMVGLKNGGIIGVDAGQFVLKTSAKDVPSLIFFSGLIVITVLHHFRIRGGVLIGIFVSALIAFFCGKIQLSGIVGLPADPMSIVFKADLGTVFRHLIELLPLIFICFFMDMFDTMGTIIGVATSAKLLNENHEIERVERVFAADATATVTGALCGQSTVTSYLESATGVEAGGRSGLTAVVVGLCFLLAMFFSPLIMAIAGYAPVTSAALVVVGVMMMGSVTEIRWDDYTEGIPAFLILAPGNRSLSVYQALLWKGEGSELVLLSFRRLPDPLPDSAEWKISREKDRKTCRVPGKMGRSHFGRLLFFGRLLLSGIRDGCGPFALRRISGCSRPARRWLPPDRRPDCKDPLPRNSDPLLLALPDPLVR